eukprot:13781399-Alexandrium_andersonii.AAC.1
MSAEVEAWRQEVRGGSLNVASWYKHSAAAIAQADRLHLDWLLLQEVRLDARQAAGARNRIGRG